MNRDPAKLRAWRARSRPLRSRSPRRAAERDQRDQVRRQVLARDGGCVARDVVPEVACWHPAGEPLDVDEIVLRSGRAGGHLDPDNCQTLCRAHHEWKHDHPAEAVVRGLRRWSWADNLSTPDRYPDGGHPATKGGPDGPE